LVSVVAGSITVDSLTIHIAPGGTVDLTWTSDMAGGFGPWPADTSPCCLMTTTRTMRTWWGSCRRRRGRGYTP